ncbi:MAG: ATP-grasp domain-containing protein, partial [Bombella apis]|nr:ATP-grasp domain-containing protein [Bombella apis]
PADAIDRAEDRERFQAMLRKLGLRQPRNGIARNPDEALKIAEEVGYPVVARPSYVLGGRAMEIVYDKAGLSHYLNTVLRAAGEEVATGPVLLDHYLNDAIEADVDCIADGQDVYVAGVMEHIEEAGIHSGDSACSLPPYTLSPALVTELREQTEAMARELGIRGLMNVQFAIKDDEVFVLEVNPRASRTVPFVAKATGVPVAKIGARIMAGAKLADFPLEGRSVAPHVAVKEAVFPFSRFSGVDTILGPEMRSTGEVMGLDANFEM